ncbi:MAG: nicotinate (nicotinamide) nucleotide adenylyltransferase [Opitutia bacterium AMD-G3]|jgi:nicotinate-nucleotide adenylyltransferase|nr:MAG: nicotinate (nicotinamide) nucleotide adenylyltransferase [Opitutae bacterium AMD-G3]
MPASFGILGGTFDPPHAGHVAAAVAAWRQLGLDEVKVIPAGLAPLRAVPPLASSAHRLAMAKLAFAPCAWARVDDREVRRTGICWSVDTARDLAAEFPDARRVWIIGADQLARLDRWKDIDTLGRLVEFAVLSRDGLPVAAPATIAGFIRLTVLKESPVRVSSTALRAALAAGEPAGNGLPNAVRAYIEEHSLYKS